MDQWAALVREIRLRVFTVLGSNIQSLFVYLSIKCDKSPFVKHWRSVLGPVSSGPLSNSPSMRPVFRKLRSAISFFFSISLLLNYLLISLPGQVLFSRLVLRSFRAGLGSFFFYFARTKLAPREPQRAHTRRTTQRAQDSQWPRRRLYPYSSAIKDFTRPLAFVTNTSFCRTRVRIAD